MAMNWVPMESPQSPLSIAHGSEGTITAIVALFDSNSARKGNIINFHTIGLFSGGNGRKKAMSSVLESP
ncbi:hypothetical protein QTG54_016150 [Skeletonema marinoi]|uniref:Uncharacterized protein n=1 Tax=Skeletonema marinoi TaxID=267567 RepID=A0AAD8XTG7_9STRA|nr:hypothetical protein QTG54_016150 [Skeletonema marinoi]